MEDRNIIGPALLSACLWLAAFPPLNLWWLSFFAAVPLFIGITNQRSTKSAFKLGALFGLLFIGGFHSWILELRAWGPTVGVSIMWVLYSLYLSLFYGALSATLYKFKSAIWSFPVIWIGFEYLKSISAIGNPAGSAGYTLGFAPLLNQVASIGGIFLLSFLVIVINTLIFYTVNARPKYSYKYLGIAAITLVMWIGVGYLSLNQTPSPIGYKNVSIIQPNHPQEKKLNKYSWATLRKEHLRLIEKNIVTAKPSLIFLPETITPGLNTKRPHFIHPLSELSQKHSIGIFFGTPIKRNTQYFNSIALMTPNGLSKETYDKVQLMPFGEYWPAKSLFLSLGLKNVIPGNEFTPGKGLWPLLYDDTEVGALVCLESIYPWIGREMVKNKATLLYVAANNAWFFDSSAANKHLQMSTLRAIETHRSLLHVTNTGISAFINPKGKIGQETILDTQAIITKTVPLYSNKTVYILIGESWILLLILLSVGIGLYRKKLRKS